MIYAQRTDTGLGLPLAVFDGAGPVTGLSPTVRIRDGATADSYLDFDDLTFKTSAWVDQDASMTEVGGGHYEYDLDLSALSLASIESLVIEYHNAASPPVDASDVVVLQQLAEVALQLTVTDSTGGVAGLTGTVRVRDSVSDGSFLDFADNTFKGSGWTTLNAPLTDLGRGHYHRSLDTGTLIGQATSELVAEYLTAGDVVVATSEIIAPLYSVAADATPPTVEDFDPAIGSTVEPGDTVAFSVLDNESTFSALAVLAFFVVAGDYEVIHDGNGFAPQYAQSTRAAVLGGWRYTLTRRSGWPREALSVRVLAADGAGNVVTL